MPLNPDYRGGEKPFDQTSCRETTYGFWGHRDYAAHFFRWAFMKNRFKQTDVVLDVGCGPDRSLMRLLIPNPGLHPKLYVGVDMNALKPTVMKWARLHDRFNFVKDGLTLQKKYGLFDKAVCFEVLEHMKPPDGLKLLKNVHALLKPNGEFYMSTPVFIKKQALNHIHEYTLPELQAAIKKAGFVVKKRYGTFGRLNYLEKALTPGEQETWNKLRPYYGNDAMSVIFAPLHPDQASNNLWILGKEK